MDTLKKILSLLSKLSPVAKWVVVLSFSVAVCGIVLSLSSCSSNYKMTKVVDSTIHKESEYNGSMTITRETASRSTSRSPVPLSSFIWVFFLVPNFYKLEILRDKSPEDISEDDNLKEISEQPDELPYGILCEDNPPISQKVIYSSRVFDKPEDARDVYLDSLTAIRESFEVKTKEVE